MALADARNEKIRNSRCTHSLFPSGCYRPLSARCRRFTWAIEAIDDEAVDKLREGQSDCIFSFHDEDLLEAPFDHIRLFESQLFPVCASDEHGEALFNLAQPHFPLLNYSRNSPAWGD